MSTISLWKKEHKEFSEALKRGKADIDEQVTNALLRRALGARVDHVTKDGDVVKKKLPPDTTACIFWLKNRRPDEWRDVNHTRHGADEGMQAFLKELAGRNGGSG